MLLPPLSPYFWMMVSVSENYSRFFLLLRKTVVM